MILNNAIRMGTLLTHAAKFVGKHQQALSQVPVVYLVVCRTMKGSAEENRLTTEAYLDRVREIRAPVGIGLFAEVADYGKLSLPARTMSIAMRASEGDFGDWEAIRSWAPQARSYLSEG